MTAAWADEPRRHRWTGHDEHCSPSIRCRIIALEGETSPSRSRSIPRGMEQVLSNLIGNAITTCSPDTPVEVSGDVGETSACRGQEPRAVIRRQSPCCSRRSPRGAVVDPQPRDPRGLWLGLLS